MIIMNGGNKAKMMNLWGKWIWTIAVVFSLGFVSGIVPAARAEEKLDLDKLVGKPAELSAWAYAYRADLKVQDKPEAYFVPRRLERLNRVYRPVSLMLSQDNPENSRLAPPPRGILQSALLWEGRMLLNRVELRWPKDGPAPPSPASVEVRLYPTPFGWFGWQADRPVTAKPQISQDGLTWVYQVAQGGKSIPTEEYLPPKAVGILYGGNELGRNPDEVDMVAVFIQPPGEAKKDTTKEPVKCAVPQILAYGPENWKKIDVELEWGFKEGTQKLDFSGRVEGFFGLVGNTMPLPDDKGTTMSGPDAWKSSAASGNRRGITLPLLYIQPAAEKAGALAKFPYGHPRDTRITVWTQSGNFTFLVQDLEKGPIYAPEYGFFVAKTGSGKNALEFAAALAASKIKSTREMTREHREATWEEAMREIKLPLLPPGTVLPPYKQVDDPPMQVQVPEARWTDAWREGVSQLKKGELTYMDLALEAPRPIHNMDVVGLHDTAAHELARFMDRSGTLSDGDFTDGSGNFCIGKLFHETSSFNPNSFVSYHGCETYELVHNGGTGRILYDLAEHYFLTGDVKWFKKYQWRMQAAAEWIIRQKNSYMKDVPNRANLWVAGLQPPQHIADCAWGQSEWKWYGIIDAWYSQGLSRFAEAMAQVDPDNALKYLEESAQYRKALQQAVDRSIALSPVIRVRNGEYRSYIPPLFYQRGPSIGQVTQLGMTDVEWSLGMVDAVSMPTAGDVRVDGHMDVCEDVMEFNHTYLSGGDRFPFFVNKRKERGLSTEEDWFWGGFTPQLGYSWLANVYLRRDEIPSFLRQWVNNYAAFVMPTPEYCFMEHVMNNQEPKILEALKKGEYQKLFNGHALSYFMEQFRSLLVWEDGDTLWLAKATPRHWLEQGMKISVKNAPSYFGTTGYEIISDVDHGKIGATVELPGRTPPKAVWLRFRHPKAIQMKTVMVNGAPWTDIDPSKEVVHLHDLKGTVKVEASY